MVIKKSSDIPDSMSAHKKLIIFMLKYTVVVYKMNPHCTAEYKYLFACGAMPDSNIGRVKKCSDGKSTYYMKHPGKEICNKLTLTSEELTLNISIRTSSVRKNGRTVLMYDIHNETAIFEAVDADDVHHFLTKDSGTLDQHLHDLCVFLSYRNTLVTRFQRFFSNDTDILPTSIWAYAGPHTTGLRHLACGLADTTYFSIELDIFSNLWIVYKGHAFTIGIDCHGIYLRIIDDINKYRYCFTELHMAITMPGIAFRIGRISQKNMLIACRYIVAEHLKDADVDSVADDQAVLQEIDSILCVASDTVLQASHFKGAYFGDECFAEIKNKLSVSDYSTDPEQFD